VLDVGHGGLDQAGEGGGLDLEELPAAQPRRRHAAQVELAVFGVVRAERKHVNVVEFGHEQHATPTQQTGHPERTCRLA